MAKIWIGGKKLAKGSDEQMLSLQEAVMDVVSEGNFGWLTINATEPGEGSIAALVGPGISVAIEFDRPHQDRSMVRVV